MTIPTWATPFSDNTSTIGATFLNNYVRTQLPKCLDGVGGSDGIPSTPTTKIQVYGLGLELGGATNYLQYESESLTRTQKDLLWSNNLTGPGNVLVVVGDVGYQALRIPDGARLTAVTAAHNRQVDSGVFPATSRAAISVRKILHSTGVDSLISGPYEDPTAVIASYQAHHTFTLSGLNELIDNSLYYYYVQFDGEIGADAEVTRMFFCTATFTVTKQDKGA